MSDIKNKYDSHYKTHYQRHTESKTGSILLTLVLAMLLLLMIFGRIAAVEEEERASPKGIIVNKVVAMRIQNIDKKEQSSVVARTVPPASPKKVRTFTNKESQFSKNKMLPKTPPVKKENVVNNMEKESNRIGEKSIEEIKINDISEDTVVKKGVNESSVVEDEREFDQLLSTLLKYIEEHKSYPNAARRAGYKGIVEISVSFNKNGFITAYSLNKSSSHNLLDSAAIAIIKKLQTVQIKEVSLKKDITIIVPIRYNLD
ncbi:MAG: energy transducer TonB [Desulfovibrionaceae bacterium]